MASMKSSMPISGGNQSLGIIHGQATIFDGAGLIAPSIPCGGIPNYSLGIEDGQIKPGFRAVIEGAYPLKEPVIDLKFQAAYSLDMVRLEFFNDSQQKLVDAIDKNQVLLSMDSFTSNRIGSYRFMWAFRYANGKDGGYKIVREDDEIVDGDEDCVLKCGYGVIGKGGKQNNKGFVEFNPNKCEENGRKFLRMLYDVGCIFVLKRFDLAIDYPIMRNAVRVLRDRRKYEFVLSSKGGITEYLGSRNAPGRVKVYDKAGEQGMDCDLTRIELTCCQSWGIGKIVDHLPICNDYSMVSGDGAFLALCTMVGDILTGIDEETGKPVVKSLEVVPEKYFQMLPRNTRWKLKKVLKESKKMIEYDDRCIMKIVERANSFVL